MFGSGALKIVFNWSSKSCLVTSGPIDRLVRPSLHLYKYLQVEIHEHRLSMVPDHKYGRRAGPFAETGQEFLLL